MRSLIIVQDLRRDIRPDCGCEVPFAASLLAMITIFSLAMPVLGQSPTPPPSERLPISIDSGERGIDGGLAGEADPHEASVVFSEIVSVG
ncbi:MAG: hypothetical protein EA377_11665, partial [Phycisphaerales bacterium]